MKNILRVAGFVSMMAASAMSHATAYDFSYTFSTGNAITGSFDGSASGNLVTILSNLAISLDGVPFNDSGNLSSYGFPNGSFGGPGIVSFNGLENNFIAGDGDLMYFVSTNMLAMAAYNNGSTDTAWYLVDAGLNEDANGLYDASRWNLSAVSAVPEPEAYMLLLAGLGLAGIMARRRRAGSAAAAAAA
ncbi:MAG: hypothetical protein JWP38_3671 [Herbaspirillum sp.]|jgi:hypothetical protein|nr:hypothetical protein [Herbaspirillum sp.]